MFITLFLCLQSKNNPTELDKIQHTQVKTLNKQLVTNKTSLNK